MSKPILCIDFDGVIHSYTSPWTNAETISDPPVKGAFEWLKSLFSDFDVNIYSSRSKSSPAIMEMKNWFYKYGMEWDYIEQIKFPTQKPAAFLTIDDRAICFTGEFPEAKTLLVFKPWNKK